LYNTAQTPTSAYHKRENSHVQMVHSCFILRDTRALNSLCNRNEEIERRKIMLCHCTDAIITTVSFIHSI
jgi:hypothetical protein